MTKVTENEKTQNVDIKSQILNDIVKIETNEESREYFDKLLNVVSSLIKICEGQLSSGEQAIDEIVVLEYLKKLKQSVLCMRMKYWFNACEFSNQSSILMIDVEKSGFPVRKEFHELLIDIERAERVLAGIEPEDILKQNQLDYVLAHKKINRDIQFDMQAQQYYAMLKSSDLYLPDNEPQYIPINDAENGNKRFIAHWASFDASSNLPLIYILLIEYSGKKDFLESDIAKNFSAQIAANSASQYQLVTICSNLDKHNSDVHPKRLKRVSVGPLYINGFTRHNRNITNALAYVEEHHSSENWLFSYTVESLLSKSTMKTDSGLFSSSQQKEVYYIDPVNNTEAAQMGCSDIERSLVIPYTAYQQLADQENNSLNDIQKYVIQGEDEVIYL